MASRKIQRLTLTPPTRYNVKLAASRKQPSQRSNIQAHNARIAKATVFSK